MAVSISISITQNSQSVANNTSNVTVEVIAKWTYGSYNHLEKPGKLVIDGTTYAFASPFNINNTTSGSMRLFTKTVNVTHNSNGVKLLSCSASYTSGVSSGTVTASASKGLTTIPRGSSLSAGNGTLGTAQTLTVTKQASSFTHTITYKCGTASGTICTKSGDTSISWTPSLDLAKQNTAGTAVSVTLTITTYNGSTSVGSGSKTISCAIPAALKPSCAVAVSDPTGYADKYGGYVKGKSKIKVTVTPTLSYDSPIASYSVTANGDKYTSATFTTGVVKSNGTLAISATVKDKRGRSGSASQNVEALAYWNPGISALSVHRCNADGSTNEQGEYVKIVFSGSVAPLGNQNSAVYTLKYKKTSDSSYTSVSLSDFSGQYTVSNAAYVFEAESGSSYDVSVSVKDDFSTTIKKTSASTAFTLLHFSSGGTGVGIGKVAESERLLDIGIPVRFREGFATNILWSGTWYMTAGHSATLSEPVSKQPSGIVLVFSAYEDGEAKDNHFVCHFIPKALISTHSSVGHLCPLSTADFSFVGGKMVYINNTNVTGHDQNSLTGTKNGITFDNKHWVMRYVIGV